MTRVPSGKPPPARSHQRRHLLGAARAGPGQREEQGGVGGVGEVLQVLAEHPPVLASATGAGRGGGSEEGRPVDGGLERQQAFVVAPRQRRASEGQRTMKTNRPPLPHGALIELRRWNTPTIYNGLETYSKADRRSYVNLEEVHDFMPQMGPMVGYAITMVLQPGNPEHVQRNPDAWQQYRSYVASVPGPKIVVVQDLDKPLTYGAGWGEVISNLHRALDCVGVIVDGAIRDLDEMCYAGFKALARRLCVSHCHAWPVRWGCEVEVFGTTVKPGQLVHADKHGFVAVPFGEEKKLLEAARFMDTNECMTMIPSARATAGRTTAEITAQVDEAWRQFGRNVAKKSIGKGEWG